MLKKQISLLLIVALLIAPLGAFAENGQPEPARSPEKKTYPYLYCYREGQEAEGEINLYFADGGSVPYVALTEFIPVLTEMLNTNLKCDADRQISFDIQYVDHEGEDGVFIVSRPDNGSALIIQPGDDSMTFTNFNSFTLRPGTGALVTMMDIPDPEQSIDFSDIVPEIMRAQRDNKDATALLMMTLGAGETEDPAAQHSLFVATSKIFNRRGQPLTMRLGDYRIEILCEEGECYLPLQTMSDIFFSLKYINCIFNGEKVITDVYRGELIKQANEAAPADMDEEMAMFNYRELCFFLDHFYGLKQEHRIDSFADFFAGDAAKFPQISGTDSIAFDCALTEILQSFFDDSHSGLVRYSWRSGQAEGAEMLGQMLSIGYSTQTRIKIGNRLIDVRSKAYPEGIPAYEEIGDTAFVTFDSFTANRAPEEYYELEDPDHPQDTIELIMYANRQVRREGSPVKTS